MKEDAAAKELENLLRDALETGPNSRPQSGMQQHTVPLPFQPAAAKPLATAGHRVDVDLRRQIEEDDDEPRLAVENFATPAAEEAPPKKSRAGLFAMLGLAVIALGAGGYAWKMHRHQVAAAQTAAPTPAPSADGAVGFSVASRPVVAPAVEPKPEEQVGAATTIAKADVAKPEAAPAQVVAKEARPEPKPVAAKPEPKPVVAAAPPPAPKPEPAPKPAAAAPAPATGSVDAILQQQLKGAIP